MFKLSDGLEKNPNFMEKDMAYLQGSHRLEKYLNLEGFLEKSLKIKSALKITGKST